MRGCQNLISLDVSGCRNISFDLISTLLQLCPKLQALNIHGIDDKKTAPRKLLSPINSGTYSIDAVQRLKEKHDIETIEFESLWYPLIRH